MKIIPIYILFVFLCVLVACTNQTNIQRRSLNSVSNELLAKCIPRGAQSNESEILLLKNENGYFYQIFAKGVLLKTQHLSYSRSDFKPNFLNKLVMLENFSPRNTYDYHFQIAKEEGKPPTLNFHDNNSGYHCVVVKHYNEFNDEPVKLNNENVSADENIKLMPEQIIKQIEYSQLYSTCSGKLSNGKFLNVMIYEKFNNANDKEYYFQGKFENEATEYGELQKKHTQTNSSSMLSKLFPNSYMQTYGRFVQTNTHKPITFYYETFDKSYKMFLESDRNIKCKINDNFNLADQ